MTFNDLMAFLKVNSVEPIFGFETASVEHKHQIFRITLPIEEKIKIVFLKFRDRYRYA